MLKSSPSLATPAFNSMKVIYLGLTIVGTIVPWFWLIQDSTALLSPALFLQRAFANPIAAALTSDLLIAVLTFFSFVWVECQRLHVSRLWLTLYIALTFGVGLSCALPCFLYHREQILTRNSLLS
jgi:Terpene cyclase DEP1